MIFALKYFAVVSLLLFHIDCIEEKNTSKSEKRICEVVSTLGNLRRVCLQQEHSKMYQFIYTKEKERKKNCKSIT